MPRDLHGWVILELTGTLTPIELFSNYSFHFLTHVPNFL